MLCVCVLCCVHVVCMCNAARGAGDHDIRIPYYCYGFVCDKTDLLCVLCVCIMMLRGQAITMFKYHIIVIYLFVVNKIYTCCMFHLVCASVCLKIRADEHYDNCDSVTKRMSREMGMRVNVRCTHIT